MAAAARRRLSPGAAGARAKRPSWTCPACGRSFRHARQPHSCQAPTPLEVHFEKCAPDVRRTFDALLARLGTRARFRINSVKTMITLRAGGVFAAFKPRRAWLDGELLLDGPNRAPVFRKVWAMSARSWVHEFRLGGPGDVTPELVGLLEEALARAR